MLRRRGSGKQFSTAALHPFFHHAMIRHRDSATAELCWSCRSDHQIYEFGSSTSGGFFGEPQSMTSLSPGMSLVHGLWLETVNRWRWNSSELHKCDGDRNNILVINKHSSSCAGGWILHLIVDYIVANITCRMKLQKSVVLVNLQVLVCTHFLLYGIELHFQ